MYFLSIEINIFFLKYKSRTYFNMENTLNGWINILNLEIKDTARITSIQIFYTSLLTVT
jgi:hypothetical protein